jgi:hypothetical protein
MDQRTIPSLEKSGSTTGRYGSGSSIEPGPGIAATAGAVAAIAASDTVASPAA